MNSYLPNALHTAASAGNLDLVRSLVAAGEDVDHLDANGFSALYLAAAEGQHQVVQFLLESGADPDGLTTRIPENSSSVDPQLACGVDDDEFIDDDEVDEDEFDEDEFDDDEVDDEFDQEDEQSEPGHQGVPLLAALHHQDRTSSADVVRTLLSAGADVNIRW